MRRPPTTAQQLRAARARERRSWRDHKRDAKRGTIVLVDVGRTLVTFYRDAERVSRLFGIVPPHQHLRFYRGAPGQSALERELTLAGVPFVVVNVDAQPNALQQTDSRVMSEAQQVA